MKNFSLMFGRTAFFYGLLLSILVAWFGWEFTHTVKFVEIPWGRSAIAHLGVFSIVIVGLFLFVRQFLGQYAIGGLIAVSAIVAVGAVGVAPLFAVGAFLFSSTLLGEALTSAVGIKQRDLFHRLLQLALGAGVYATLVGLMVLVPVNYASVYFVLLVAPMFIWRSQAKELVAELFAAHQQLNEIVMRDWISSLVVFYFLAIYFCVALLPELGFDALAMHLTIPAHVAEHHRWGFDAEKYVWAVMPMNGDWLYTFAYMLGGEAAARLMNFALLLTITSLLASAVKAWASPKLVFLAIGMFLSLPLTYMESTTLFIENAWVVFALSGILCILLFVEYKESKYLLVASTLLGFALATKVLTVFLMVPLSVVAIYYVFRDLPSAEWKKLFAWCLVIFLALGAIPYVIAYLKTGNPVFPFYNAIFKSPYFDTVTSFDQPTFKMGFNFLTLRDATFSSGKFVEGQTGSFGWVFFAILPLSFLAALISRAKYAVPLVFVSITFIAMAFHSQSYLRYIFPAIPLLILVMAQGIVSIRVESKYLGATVVVVSWLLVGLNLMFLPAASWWYREMNISPILNATSRADFIENRSPVRSAVEYINASEGAQARVGIFSAPFVAGLKGTPFFANWYNDKFIRDIYNVTNVSQLTGLLRKNGINKIILDDGFSPPNIVPLLKSITTIEKQYGGISVRAVRRDLNFSEELLKSPDFQVITGWSLTDATQYNPKSHSVIVSISKIVTQAVEVTAGADYQLAATVRCVAPGSLFRLQVNWLSKKGDFLGTDLTPISCSEDFETHTKIVQAPNEASAGIIYATGHSGLDQVEYKSLSFKR